MHDDRIVAAAVLRAEQLLVSGGGAAMGGGRLHCEFVADAAPDHKQTDEC
jgi:hypothetical protein